MSLLSGALFCRLLLSVKTDLVELFLKLNESNLALKKCEEAFEAISGDFQGKKKKRSLIDLF